MTDATKRLIKSTARTLADSQALARKISTAEQALSFKTSLKVLDVCSLLRTANALSIEILGELKQCSSHTTRKRKDSSRSLKTRKGTSISSSPRAPLESKLGRKAPNANASRASSTLPTTEWDRCDTSSCCAKRE